MSNIFSVKNKIAIVTGAARGNGLGIAKGLLSAGAAVHMVDILNCPISDKNSFHHRCDISSEPDLAKLIKSIIRKHGRIDILVNNAGVTKAIPSEDYPADEWDRTLDINLRSQFMLCQLAAREMIKTKKGGSIINISSLNSRFGFSNNPAYVASKSGLSGLTRGLAKDWAKYRIRVNTICPGYFHTDMTKISFNDSKLFKERMDRSMIKRYGEPEDLVGPVIFLASDASAYVTGIELFVDGGWSVSGI